ncbi:MAG: OsmC family protein [Chloroflexota bacterium]|nr:OsmC family protein [Chloroflexota bacterium]
MSEDNAYKADVTMVEGLQFVARGAQSGVAIVLDGEEEHGGLERGIRPMECLLISLASCTGMDVISILRKKRQEVTDFCVKVEGIRADEHPKRYERITLHYIVRGHNVSEKAVARSIELSQTKYCGVTASLNSEIDYDYTIHPEH